MTKINGLKIDDIRAMNGFKTMNEHERESLRQATVGVAEWPQWKKDAYRVIQVTKGSASSTVDFQGSGGAGRLNIGYVPPKSIEDQLRQKIKELEEENSKLKNELANIKGYR